MVGDHLREREFGFALMLWAVGIWVITRIVLYVLNGHIPFAPSPPLKQKILDVVKWPWFPLAVVVFVLVFAAVVAWDASIRSRYRVWAAEESGVWVRKTPQQREECISRRERERRLRPGAGIIWISPATMCADFKASTGSPPPYNLWKAFKKSLR